MKKSKFFEPCGHVTKRGNCQKKSKPADFNFDDLMRAPLEERCAKFREPVKPAANVSASKPPEPRQ